MTDTQEIATPASLLPFTVNTVPVDAPWTWLAAGWRDMWRQPTLSLGYGLFFSLVSIAIVAALFSADVASLSMAAAGGFMLMGPMLAVGLYELSRRIEKGDPIKARAIIFVSTCSPSQLAYLGVILMVALLLWIRIAMLLFALFLGQQGFPPMEDFLTSLITTNNGIGLIATGTAIGAVMAMGVFVISAVSVPILLDRDVDFITAIIGSITAFNKNQGTMLLWAVLVGAFSALGLVTLFLGLIVIFPLLGHSTWHAYRSLISNR